MQVSGGVAIKTYHWPRLAAAEHQWYLKVGGLFAPRLIEADLQRGRLILEAGDPVSAPMIGELYRLLRSLQEHGIHHRDVWPGNLVTVEGELRLIDWETAYQTAPRCSYDLHGPRTSRVDVPGIHRQLRSGYQMWWGSDHPMSIKNQWGADVPAGMD